MATSIFDAFPNAIISGEWEIGTCHHGTVVGNEFRPLVGLDVIVDEGASSQIDTTPETIGSDYLIYVVPGQLPTTNADRLTADYMLHNKLSGGYYLVVDAGVGKNQHTGEIEHVELKIVRTEVVNV